LWQPEPASSGLPRERDKGRRVGWTSGSPYRRFPLQVTPRLDSIQARVDRRGDVRAKPLLERSHLAAHPVEVLLNQDDLARDRLPGERRALRHPGERDGELPTLVVVDDAGSGESAADHRRLEVEGLAVAREGADEHDPRAAQSEASALVVRLARGPPAGRRASRSRCSARKWIACSPRKYSASWPSSAPGTQFASALLIASAARLI
jgi:hypothetical protein